MVCATVRLTQSGTKAIAYAVMNSHTEDAVASSVSSAVVFPVLPCPLSLLRLRQACSLFKQEMPSMPERQEKATRIRYHASGHITRQWVCPHLT